MRLLLPLLILTTLNATDADDGRTTSMWRATNPGGGGAFATAAAGPTGIMIAASDLAGAYRSVDRGKTWQVVGTVDGLTATHVSGIGFHPRDGKIIHLATDDGIFRSDDAGETFQHVLHGGYVTDIAFASANPDVGYAGWHAQWNAKDGHVYRTTDGGLKWERISTNLPSELRTLKILVSPQEEKLSVAELAKSSGVRSDSPEVLATSTSGSSAARPNSHYENTVYLLSGEGRFASGEQAVFRSSDGGVTWSGISSEIGEVMDVAIDPRDASVLYATTYNHVKPNDQGFLYKSNDGGDHWSQLAHRSGVIWTNRDDDTLRLIDVRKQFPWDKNNGVWQSTDDGKTWNQTGQVKDWDTGWSKAYFAYGQSFNGEARTLGVDLSDANSLLWVNGQWVFGTTDSGRTFHNLFTNEVAPGCWQSRGFDNVCPLTVTISPSNPKQVYAGYMDIGCWRSLDDGKSWQNCNQPQYTGTWKGNGGNTVTIATDPTRASVVWASQAGDLNGTHTLLCSRDAGETWQPANEGLPGTILSGLTVDPSSPIDQRHLFVTAGGQVFRSHDDGASWSKCLDEDGFRYTAVDSSDGQLVYAGGEVGLWRSAKGGESGSWTSIGLPEMTGNHGDVLVDSFWNGTSAITTDPKHPGWVYASVLGRGKGLFRSKDRGKSWEKLLTDDHLRDMKVSPANSRTLFTTSSSALNRGGYSPTSTGIQRSTDGGATWQKHNEGLHWPFAKTIVVNPDNPNIVFVGSPGTGIVRRVFDE